MTDESDLLPALLDHYGVNTKHLPNSSRSDWTVPPGSALVASATEAPDFMSELRRFFMAMDVEVEQYRDDPVATTSALARIDALLADLKSVRATLDRATAESLSRYGVRRLAVQGVATVESSWRLDRKGWRHEELLPVAMRALGLDHLVNTETGETFDADDLAVRIMSVLNPSWKQGGLKGLGLNPDDWCEFTSDDDGRPARVPTVRFHDNAIRTPHRQATVTSERGDR